MHEEDDVPHETARQIPPLHEPEQHDELVVHDPPCIVQAVLHTPVQVSPVQHGESDEHALPEVRQVTQVPLLEHA